MLRLKRTVDSIVHFVNGGVAVLVAVIVVVFVVVIDINAMTA